MTVVYFGVRVCPLLFPIVKYIFLARRNIMLCILETRRDVNHFQLTQSSLVC